MARPPELCDELNETNRRTYNGMECSCLLPNGTYQINYQALYECIVQWSYNISRPCTIGSINIGFGLRGTWGEDVAVKLALNDLVALKVIEIDPKTKIITPLMGITMAKKIMPKYTPLKKALAGLHGLEEHE